MYCGGMTTQQRRQQAARAEEQAAARWFAAGYQEALADIAAALEAGGEPAVRTWLNNNRTQTEN